jgi:pimeloyl-ACP methyl ester carboxylesterase
LVGVETREITLHGHRVRYRETGDGPPLVLLHGITSSSETWGPVLELLGRRYRVIAPDLIGHGDSAKPRGDYSPGAYASGVRDLLAALGHDHVNIVGHSMGGGVAMQFAYQFPERCKRLILVCSGGLGAEVSFLLRAASLPGSELVLPFLCNRRVLDIGSRIAGLAGRLPVAIPPGVREVARGYASLGEARARAAFLHTLRSVIDHAGQRIDASDRLYLASEVPTMVLWGGRDPIIPVEHAYAGHEAMPGSRLEIFERSGHFPHQDEPARFSALVHEFVASTRPAQLNGDHLRMRLVEGSADLKARTILPDVAQDIATA